jgi:hypothetical protein
VSVVNRTAFTGTLETSAGDRLGETTPVACRGGPLFSATKAIDDSGAWNFAA